MPDYYETAAQLNEYLVFHYASAAQTLPWKFGPHQALDFHRRLAGCVDCARLPPQARALDLGCAVGRTTFELSRHCGEVVGIDASHAFIAAAERIRQQCEISFELKGEGELGEPCTVALPCGVHPARVRFERGDAQALPAALGRFDIVVFANVLDRLPQPRRALRGLEPLLDPGGQLLICSPFTWWDEFTAPQERLGGYRENGREVTSLDSLHRELDPAFELQALHDLPFLIREHARKYHFSVAQTSLWTRRAPAP